MKSNRANLLALAALLCFGTYANAQSAAPSSSASRPTINLQMPAPPPAVPVKLIAATTALMVLDIADRTCKPQPKCMNDMLPHIASLLAQARKAGVYVVYSRPAAPFTSDVLTEVAPAAGDAIITAPAQDKFYGTELDQLLKTRGITTVILTGWRINGAVVYTSVGATLRGYTVVVPEDTSLAATEYDVAIGRYQILTQLSSNASNEPLKARASTLTRTDLITFQ
jgi:nicotinamidase-related amidase